jgi:hypothetical protein
MDSFWRTQTKSWYIYNRAFGTSGIGTKACIGQGRQPYRASSARIGSIKPEKSIVNLHYEKPASCSKIDVPLHYRPQLPGFSNEREA